MNLYKFNATQSK